MTEQMTALAENYPAAAELLRRHGGDTLLAYLGQLHHRPLPDSGAAAACPPPTTIIPRSST